MHRIVVIALAMVCLAAGCKARTSEPSFEVKALGDPPELEDARATAVARFTADLRSCIARQFAPPPLEANEKKLLDDLWAVMTSGDAACIGCHMSRNPQGDPARLMVQPDGKKDDFLQGLARRDIFTRQIVKACIAPTSVRARLLTVLEYGKTEWNGLPFFKAKTGATRAELEGLARHLLSGAFDEPVSEEPLELLVRWMGQGGRFEVDHHVTNIVEELRLVGFNSSNPEVWGEIRVEDQP